MEGWQPPRLRRTNTSVELLRRRRRVQKTRRKRSTSSGSTRQDRPPALLTMEGWQHARKTRRRIPSPQCGRMATHPETGRRQITMTTVSIWTTRRKIPKGSDVSVRTLAPNLQQFDTVNCMASSCCMQRNSHRPRGSNAADAENPNSMTMMLSPPLQILQGGTIHESPQTQTILAGEIPSWEAAASAMKGKDDCAVGAGD